MSTRISALTLLLLSLTATLHAKNSSVIPIGVVLGFSGREANSAHMIFRGIALAINDVNRSGGIRQKHIRLHKYDNQQELEGTLRSINTAIADGVLAILGPQFSSNVMAAGKIVDRAGVPLITPYATHPDVTRNRRFVFRTCFSDNVQGKSLGQFLRDTLDISRVAVMTNVSNDYSIGLSDIFSEDMLTFGGAVAMAQYHDSTTDYRPQLRKLLKRSPEALFIPGYNFDSSMIIQQTVDLGYQGVILGGDGWADTDTFHALMQSNRASTHRVFAATHWHAHSGDKRSLDFVRRFTKRYKTHPVVGSALGYDSAAVLTHALRQVDRLEPDQIGSALRLVRDFPGITGRISFHEGHAAKKDVVIVRLENKKFRYFQRVRIADSPEQ
jgi:branched-chain amino acid transport system substrate-binding protein